MKHYKLKIGKGFTIIEILIAVSIVVILTAIIYGSLQSYRNKGKDARVRQTLSEIQVKVENQDTVAGVTDYQSTFTQANVQKSLTDLATELGVTSGTYSLSASTNEYVVVFPLSDGTYYCIDALHNAKVVFGLPNTTGAKNCDNTASGSGTGTGAGAGTNIPPVANAGANQTITLPASTATLTGSGTDADGIVVSYAWTKVSGPTGGTIVNPSSAATSVTGLTAGTYDFRLTVTDNQGATGYSDMNIIVKASVTTCFGSCPHALPGTLQAEDYDNGGEGVAYHDTTSWNSGGATYRNDAVDIENTTDAGGGYDIAYIADGEWQKYTVSIGSTGNYSVSIRAASATGDGYVRMLMDGREIAALVVPNTGGWQTWQTITVTGVPLTAGTHSLTAEMHVSTQWGGMNINSYTFTYQGAISAPNPAARTLALHGPMAAAYGTPMYYYDSLPRGYYDDPARSYPLLVFLHGAGEAPPNPPTSLLTGPGVVNQINNGAQLEYTINGKTETFVVLAPQADWWWNVNNIDQIIEFAKLNYKIDPSRIYLTGLSAGSGGTAKYFAYSPAYGDAYPRKIAAAALFDGMPNTPSTTETSKDGSTSVPLNYCYAGSTGLPLWLFESTGHYPAWMESLIATLNGCTPAVNMKITKTTDTDSFTKGYVTDHTYYNPNVYEWLLQHSLGGTTTPQPPATNSAPTANAGGNQTITLPTTTATLNGSGSDLNGYIASYAWTQISGAAATITSPSSATTNVTGLTAGSYTFRLTVTDNQGATGYNDAVITVNSAPLTTPYTGTPAAIPGIIEAENYDKGGEGVAYHDSDPANQGGQYRPTEGVDIENKTGGGYDVGWTAAGEWMKYTVNVATAGSYTLQATTASPFSSSASINFELDGTLLATATMPQTASFQTWQTFIVGTVTLPQGQHIIRIYENSPNFNIDSFSFIKN